MPVNTVQGCTSPWCHVSWLTRNVVPNNCHQNGTCFISPLWHKVAPRFLENCVYHGGNCRRSRNLPIFLAEIKFFFQNGIVCNELSIICV